MSFQRFETAVDVDAHQFYLRDPDVEWEGDYTNDPYADDGLGVAPGVIGAQSPRAAGQVPVFIELLDEAPGEVDPAFDKVTVASIEVSRGRLHVEDNDVSTARLALELAPGTYVVRVLYANLDTVAYDDEEGAEHYVLQIHPGPTTEPAILRGYEPVDEPVLTPRTSRQDAAAALASGDPSIVARALVDLACAGALDVVANVEREHPSHGVRLVAAHARLLMGSADGDTEDA